MKKIFLVLILLSAVTLSAKGNRWTISGNHAVQWVTSKGSLPYADHIEMSGLRASVVYYWSVDAEKHFAMDRHLVFPMLRTIPPVGCRAATWIS